MKIKKIQLKNGYKRFCDLTIDLGDNPQRIVALIGQNGCGKSSVFDGMFFLNNAHNQIGNKGSKSNEYHSKDRNTKFDYQNISIEFEQGLFNTVYNSKATNGKQNTIFSFRSPYRYNSNLKINDVKSISEIRLNTYGASYSSDLDDKMEESYRRLRITYDSYLNSQDCKPSEAKEKIIGELNLSLHNCLDIEIVSLGNIEDSKGTLYFKKTDHDIEFEFNVLSSGEKEVVDILLDLYLRKIEYSDTIFIIDEPELHINTSIQRKLLIEIDKLIGENCQIWIATHSIGFLRALQGELKDKAQIIHFPKNYEFASKPYTLIPMVNSRSKWKELFEIALEDLTSLISPKKIIYCEGKDKPGNNGQEKGLDAKVFNKIFSKKYHDILFISSGGNTELDQRSEIAILLLTKVFNDLEILVLKDRDISSGKKTSLNDRDIYLKNNNKNHRVLIRWEIENYLYDKEILKKYCISNGLTFNEEMYDEFVTDINNQNLKDETGKIKNICGINTSINPESFKENLSDFFSEDMEIYKELDDCIFNNL